MILRTLWILALRLSLSLQFAKHTPPDPIRLAVLAPSDDKLPFSLQKVFPAAEYAVQTLVQKSGRKMSVVYRDTKCHSAYGPLEAFALYKEGLADAFFGPVCPYVLAPVARYSTVWGVPLLTATGQIVNFDQKDPQYRTLTRMNGSYSQVGQVFLKVLEKFGWTILGLLFHDYEDRARGYSDCNFALGAVHIAFKQVPYWRSFDETKVSDYREILLKVAEHARSELHYGIH